MNNGAWPAWLAGAVGVALMPAVATAQAEVFRLQVDVLGAPANLIVNAASPDVAYTAIAAALAEIDRLDRILSGHRDDSELARLNSASSLAVSPELFEVIDLAEQMRSRTDGAFNARLGAVEALWRDARACAPDRAGLQAAAHAAAEPVMLDRAARVVHRPEGVVFSLDAIAKGYIIDRALAAGRSAAPVSGMLVDIGGDMRCQGAAGADDLWPVGLPDPSLPFVNAPLVAQALLRNQAIATSGRGPRDRTIGAESFSTTLAAETGWPVDRNLAATVVAPTAAEADGLATALLALPPAQGLELASRRDDVHARITDAGGTVHVTSGWAGVEGEPRLIRVAATTAQRPAAARPVAPAARTAPRPAVKASPGPAVKAAAPNPATKGASPPATTTAAVSAAPAPVASTTPWPRDWALQIFYEAPGADPGRRASDFRPPYMAMWITDKQNRPIRTLVLVGEEADWHRDNFVWWSLYRNQAPRLVELRSTGTALSGRYPTFWPGYDDAFKFHGLGEYILHIETSRERGQHTSRTIPVTLGQTAFQAELPETPEGGGVTLVYGKRN